MVLSELNLMPKRSLRATEVKTLAELAQFYTQQQNKEPAMVQVFTLSGTVVINTKIIGKETIVTNGLPAGLYLVKIVTAGGVVTKSLVVE